MRGRASGIAAIGVIAVLCMASCATDDPAPDEIASSSSSSSFTDSDSALFDGTGVIQPPDAAKTGDNGLDKSDGDGNVALQAGSTDLTTDSVNTPQSIPSCTQASGYLNAARSAASQATAPANADYQQNTVNWDPYNVYPQEDRIGTANENAAISPATQFDLTHCVTADAARTDAIIAFNNAQYAISGAYFVWYFWPSYGPDYNDPRNSWNINNTAAANEAAAISILNSCSCIAPPPTFYATPTTVTIPAGQSTGSTTVSWNAPYHGSLLVTVSVDGATASNFAGGGTTGSSTATWIQANHTYVFRLYDSGNTSTSLASATVRGVAGPVPTVSASPTTVQIPYPRATGSSTVSWSAPGIASVEVWVGMDSQAATPFAGGGSTGSSVATWIQPNHVYHFTLRNHASPSVVLATVNVTGQWLYPSIVANPQIVHIPAGHSTGSTVISWSAAGYASTGVWVSMDGAAATPMAGGGPSGSVTAPWIQPGHSYRFILYQGGTTSPTLAAINVTGVTP